MLSHIVRIVNQFERRHGVRPNLLHLNHEHLAHLHDGFSREFDIARIMAMLQMDLIIDDACTHPHVSRVETVHRHIA